ncbi:hypothetical protein Pla175_42210 [Pirellulimonas nuda]|uniref:LamG-like jellyroll fold domain-containing protein n=1 Tax=Pirellulimonas nuda TaxID=2528009 RepID=A0A518DH54_9BACT|nr:LamG domain-containing protein [Pirellulimonas nuda]QDU90808.1 hypothetical protein Pla175_42210 [Pirellulimonas nuda]
MRNWKLRAVASAALLLSAYSGVHAAEVLRLSFENAGNLAQDTSGNNRTGAIADAGFFGVLASSANVRPGSAGASSALFEPIDFENGKFIQFPTAAFPNFTPSDNFTVRLWVNPNQAFIDDPMGSRGIVSGVSEGAFANSDWQIENGSTVASVTAFGSFDLVDGGDLAADTWQEIILSYHAVPQTVLAYVDGQLTGVGGFPVSMESFIVGANRNLVRVYSGLMDDLVVSDTSFILDGNGMERALGDLDFDGDIDPADWQLFRSGQGADLSMLTTTAAYQMGDVNFDGVTDINDFVDFKSLYIDANGAAAFAALPTFGAVPEPSAGLLACCGFVLMAAVRAAGRVRSWTPRVVLVAGCVVALAACVLSGAPASAQVIVFDFGATSNFPIADQSPLDPLMNTQGGVTMTLQGFTTNAPGSYGSNATGIGIFSANDAGNTNTMRRMDTAVDGETFRFSFDTDINLSSLRVGSLQSENEGFRLSYVSGGVDPFGGGNFTYITSDMGASEGPEDDIPLGDIAVAAGTVLEFSSLENVVNDNGGLLWNDLRVFIGARPRPLTLQVFSNGELRLVGGTIGGATPPPGIEIDAIQIVSADAGADGGSLNPAGFTGLAGDPGFPGGNGSGNGWEPGLANSATFIAESFLLGSSVVLDGAEISLGSGFVPGGEQDLTFLYRQVGQTEIQTGIVRYLASEGLSGDFNDDGVVDAADYTVWRDNLGGNEAVLNGNGDGSGTVDPGDYTTWKNGFGNPAVGGASPGSAVPEPAAAVSLFVVLGGLLGRRTCGF